jgi:hypothetical protein
MQFIGVANTNIRIDNYPLSGSLRRSLQQPPLMLNKLSEVTFSLLESSLLSWDIDLVIIKKF